MRNLILVFSTLSIIFGCNKNPEFSANNELQDSLIGDWEEIIRIDKDQVFIDMGPRIGYSFSKDSMDSFYGFFNKEREYYGNFVKYKLEGNQLYTKNIITNEWQGFFKIKKIKNDTLFIIEHDSSLSKLRRLKYNFKIEKDFDKIIYSSSPCYGSCPIIDISLDRNGNASYQGVAFTNKVGFYSGKLDQKTTNFIFKKFEKANIQNLKNNYNAGHTDDQTIMTTFVKNGKIIKSIYDYGREAPNELVWAYVPIGNIFSITKLDKIKADEDFPNLRLFSFLSKNKELSLEDSEGFYLWTELRKSQKKEISFSPLYKISFNYYHYMDKNENIIEPIKTLKTIVSDGRYYKFEFIDKHSITYDLGYDFIKQNFKQEDFK